MGVEGFWIIGSNLNGYHAELLAPDWRCAGSKRSATSGRADSSVVEVLVVGAGSETVVVVVAGVGVVVAVVVVVVVAVVVAGAWLV